jgi:hypothetical protein
MHRKYAKDGFVALSVNLDDLHKSDDPPAEIRERILKFLRKQDATLTNLIVSDPQLETFQKLGIETVPCVYVFNRDNHFVLKQKHEADYDVVEKTVQELLKK